MKPGNNRGDDVLDRFHPAVASWFRDQFGEPTPPQRMGWPAIASGQNTLIVAPTGSGKTLAAFLAALDHLWRTPRREKGVRILYVSPLKALNQDIGRNLQFPLEGILEQADAAGTALPPLSVGIRSGDTPSQDRARMVRKAPDILITTPESLHLMLTSRARGILRGVSHVIVDEIHAVCGNKRGVFLALLLERLAAINPSGFVRIGLSATQRPLEEVARYLGGFRRTGDGSFEPRLVTIVDAGWRRNLDLSVIWPASPDHLPEVGTIWPAIEAKLAELVRQHRSTIVFTNNRRTVEKLTARLNEAAASDWEGEATREGEAPSESFPFPARQDSGPPRDDGEGHRPFRAHHGSLSLEERRTTEEALKNGEMPAVVATASLELGIDMGAVDLVCQVESPGNVARGLQRVGRAGHVVHGTSRGRLIAKTPSDLLESAALCRAMLEGRIEHLRVPTGCLDVLAQQVIACVAVEPWDVPALFDLVRCAYPYRDLTAEAFESVLRLVSGRFPSPGLRDLRARLAWDPIHNRLAALPGTGHLALVGGGTIPDTGQFPVYLGDGGPRLGELDEEFVFERRVGETFMLGSATWRIDAIEPHRVLVSRAEGQPGVMPFWRGEAASCSPELGEAIGALSREVAGRLDDPELLPWLERECRLEPPAARMLARFLGRQQRAGGAIPDDRTILIESFRDQAGELGLAVLTPFGGKLHLGLKLALLGRIRRRLGLTPACLHVDAGLLFRLPDQEEPPLDLFDGLTGDLAEELIREELPETALFGLRFRQNAARAMLMPRPDPAKRTPLWLQRLRAKDLLQVARQYPDFPIILETFRECLDEDLDLPRLRGFLDAVQAGSIRVVRRRGEVPSPMTSELVFALTAAYVYSSDEPTTVDRKPASAVVDEDLLGPLLRDGLSTDPRWLDPQAIGRVDTRLRRTSRPPRTAEEMAEHIRRLGDLTDAEIAGPMASFLTELEQARRAVAIELPGTDDPRRWISAEDEALYLTAFPETLVGTAMPTGDGRRPVGIAHPTESNPEAARASIVERFLRTHALVGLDDVTARYPISPAEATDLLERWAEEGTAIRVGNPDDPADDRWAERENLTEMRRVTVAVRRRESLAVAPEVFADFLLRWQHVHPSTRGEGPAFVETILEQLQGLAMPARLWEADVLPRRVAGYRPSWLDDFMGRGDWLWRADGSGRSEPRVAFFTRDFVGLDELPSGVDELGLDEARILELLGGMGASFAAELARASGLEPSRVRRALLELAGRGLATNDRFDPMRAGGDATLSALTEASRDRAGGRSLRIRPRRSIPGQSEGRWSRLNPPSADPEARLLAWASALLDRYGVLSREVVALEPSAPGWGGLAPLLARAEWRGEVRRGYFVEGLSGVQYASEEAAAELARLAAHPEPASPVVLLPTVDPANLYGAGAPLDVELLDGGTARLPRVTGNYLAIRDGRPVLIAESHGKRLTALPWASPADIDSALKLLPTLIGPGRRILKVELYNGMPAAEGLAAGRLAELGFVRDYPGMAYYAGWATSEAGSTRP
jgi:ATP-dependent Lhr-like helicase